MNRRSCALCCVLEFAEACCAATGASLCATSMETASDDGVGLYTNALIGACCGTLWSERLLTLLEMGGVVIIMAGGPRSNEIPEDDAVGAYIVGTMYPAWAGGCTETD